jgi:hypothetical protein
MSGCERRKVDTMRVRSGHFRDDDGVALVTVIGVMVIVTLLAVGSYMLATQALHESNRLRDETHAFRAANAGLDSVITSFDEATALSFPEEGIVGAVDDGTYTVKLKSFGGDEYELSSLGVGSDGTTETVAVKFFYFDLWKMNLGGVGPTSVVSGASALNGTSNIVGPFYMKGNLEVGANMSIREGPLFVKGGNIVKKSGAFLLGEPDHPIKLYCDGDWRTVADSTNDNGTISGFYEKSPSNSVPDIRLPDLSDENLENWKTKALSESIDNVQGSPLMQPPPPDPIKSNLEATGGGSSYLTMSPPNNYPTAWTRKMICNSAATPFSNNACYKFVGAASGDIASKGNGTYAVVINDATPSFGSWGSMDTTECVLAGDGHYVDESGDILVNRHDDLAFDATNGILYAEGTIFIDGSLEISRPIKYIGNATIICNGNITLNSDVVPYYPTGATNTHSCGEENGWALGFVTPRNIYFSSSNGNSGSGATADELRAAPVNFSGAFFAERSAVFTHPNIRVRGSIIAGKLDTGTTNAYLLTNPLLPKYLPESLPGAGQGMLAPGLWSRR